MNISDMQKKETHRLADRWRGSCGQPAQDDGGGNRRAMVRRGACRSLEGTASSFRDAASDISGPQFHLAAGGGTQVEMGRSSFDGGFAGGFMEQVRGDSLSNEGKEVPGAPRRTAERTLSIFAIWSMPKAVTDYIALPLLFIDGSIPASSGPRRAGRLQRPTNARAAVA